MGGSIGLWQSNLSLSIGVSLIPSIMGLFLKFNSDINYPDNFCSDNSLQQEAQISEPTDGKIESEESKNQDQNNNNMKPIYDKQDIEERKKQDIHSIQGLYQNTVIVNTNTPESNKKTQTPKKIQPKRPV